MKFYNTEAKRKAISGVFSKFADVHDADDLVRTYFDRHLVRDASEVKDIYTEAKMKARAT